MTQLLRCKRLRASSLADKRKALPAWRVRKPQLVLVLLAVLLAQDQIGVVRIGLVCAVLHEAGHILAYCLLLKRCPAVEISYTGLQLSMKGVLMPPWQEMLLAAVGVASNFGGALAALLWMRYVAGYSYAGYWFMASNLLLGGINLLPVAGLDGQRIFLCLRNL